MIQRQRSLAPALVVLVFAAGAPRAAPAEDSPHVLTVQGQLRSAATLPRGLELDLMLRYVGELPDPRIPDYVEADARLGWSVRPELSVSIAGRDLLHSRHPEFSTVPQRELQRRGEVQLEWRF